MPVPPGPAGVKSELHKFKAGKLHSGSPTGKIVTSRPQAIAIALKEAGMSKKRRGGGGNPSGAPTKPTGKTPGALFTPKVRRPKANGLY